MNALPQTNGEGAQQIVITLDLAGNLNVNCPQNKIVALGMLAAAQAVILAMPIQRQTILPVKQIIP